VGILRALELHKGTAEISKDIKASGFPSLPALSIFIFHFPVSAVVADPFLSLFLVVV